MITFHDAKAIHFICMAFFLSTLIIYFLNPKKMNFYLYVFSILGVFVSGIYLSLRVGIDIFSPPKWLGFKLTIFVLSLSFPIIINKKFKALKLVGLWGAITLIMFIMALSVYKPLFI